MGGKTTDHSLQSPLGSHTQSFQRLTTCSQHPRVCYTHTCTFIVWTCPRIIYRFTIQTWSVDYGDSYLPTASEWNHPIWKHLNPAHESFFSHCLVLSFSPEIQRRSSWLTSGCSILEPRLDSSLCRHQTVLILSVALNRCCWRNLAPSWLWGFDVCKQGRVHKGAHVGKGKQVCWAATRKTQSINPRHPQKRWHLNLSAFPGVKGASRLGAAAAVWIPSLRPWRQQMLICRGVGGGLWPSGEPRRSLWGAPSWSYPLMQLPHWLWTLGKKYRNKDRDQTATKQWLYHLDSAFTVTVKPWREAEEMKWSEMVCLSFNHSINSSRLHSEVGSWEREYELSPETEDL